MVIERCCEENYTVLRQNGLFECNKKRLFEELEGNEKSSDVTPVEEECQNFWAWNLGRKSEAQCRG